MSELISGKEAKLAWVNGLELEFYSPDLDIWYGLNDEPFMSDVFDTRPIRLKPRTMTLNGVKVPAPFEPKEGDGFWHVSTENNNGYAWQHFEDKKIDYSYIQFGAWRTEDEIKQVVSALRSIFKGEIVK